MIPFGIGPLRYDKHTPRAEFNTESAPFAAFFDNMDDTAGYLDAVPVQRLSPIFHDFSLISD